jgi:hypothetical protein
MKAHWKLPKEVRVGPFIGRYHIGSGSIGYSMMVKEGSAEPNPSRWRDYPHRRFVNLPVQPIPESGEEIIDPKAMLAFVRQYGPLDHLVPNEEDKEWTAFLEREGYLEFLKEKEDCLMLIESAPSVETISKEVSGYSSEQIRNLANTQSFLKYAWSSEDERALVALDDYLSGGLPIHFEFDLGQLTIYVGSVQRLILMLFLRDQANGKTAICANPDCPAPFFLRSRKTQKICEAGGCVAWAQRNYALKWWRENMSKESKSKNRSGE